MNELKFRIWDNLEKEWTNYAPQLRFNYKSKIFNFFGTSYQRKNYILQMCTSLKDKNGADLYEGDIVSVRLYDDWGDDEGYDVIYQIAWCKRHVGWRGFTKGMLEKNYSGVGMPTPITLLGNIFENPTLLV